MASKENYFFHEYNDNSIMLIRDHQQAAREFNHQFYSGLETLMQLPQLSHPQTSDMPTGSSTGQSIQTLQARLPVSTGSKCLPLSSLMEQVL